MNGNPCEGVQRPCEGVQRPYKGVQRPCEGVIRPYEGVQRPYERLIRPCKGVSIFKGAAHHNICSKFDIYACLRCSAPTYYGALHLKQDFLL